MKAQSLKEVEAALKRIERKRKKNKSRNNKLYNQLNKKYRDIDWNKEWFVKADFDEALPNSSLGVLRKMREEKVVRCFRKEFYKKSNIENLFLLQEQMCLMDNDYWHDTVRNKKKIEYTPYYFDSAYRGKIWICHIPTTKLEKSKLVTEFLKTKEYLFDEESPFFKGHNKTRYFISKNLINGKVEKWDYYLKRFLGENQ